MKALFEDTECRAINPVHRHDDYLDGQLVVIDCNLKKEVVRLDLYKKGQKTYYCCTWISGHKMFVTGSGKSNSRFGAVYAALSSAKISFDDPLPELGRNFDVQVWHKLKRYALAIAQAAGADNCYVHHCLSYN